MGVDTMPVYDVVDEFRKACVTSKVIDGDRSMVGRLRYLRPAIDWTRVHVIDFGYMFNIGSDRPEALSTDDVETLRQPVMLHGIHLAYPNMLFIERVGPPTTPMLYASYIYDTDDGLVVQYYARQRGAGINGWVYVGTCDHVRMLTDDGLGVFTRQVHDWNLFCPPHAMPPEDQDSANHFLRMTLVLIGALMRRDDEVQVVPEYRDPRKPSTAFVKRDVPSVSVIHLAKQRLISNLRDEKEAAPDVVPRTLAAHDRAGTIVARIRDLTCEHQWFEEFRNEYRWRKRCQRCNSCTFWRLGAKVHGGARGPTLHTVSLS